VLLRGNLGGGEAVILAERTVAADHQRAQTQHDKVTRLGTIGADQRSHDAEQ
jgi:hypothetical protein